MASLIGLETISELIPGISEAGSLALPYIEKLALQGTVTNLATAIAGLTGSELAVIPTLSANEILRQTRSAGLQIRRSVGLQVIKQIRTISNHATVFNEQTPGTRPLRSSIPFAVSKQANRYYIRVAVRTYNVELGVYDVMPITLRSESLLTNNQIALKLTDLFLNSGNYATKEYQGHVVLSYTQKAPTKLQ